MRSRTKQTKKHRAALTERIPVWLVIALGLAAMLLFAYAVPAVVLQLGDRAQLTAISQGTRESVNVDFMDDVEELEIREKLRRVALASEQGEQLYTITTSQTMTRDEQLTFLQNVCDRNEEILILLENVLSEPLLVPAETYPGEVVPYVVLDGNANYLFSVYYMKFQDYDNDTVQLLADRSDYMIYSIDFNGTFDQTLWRDELTASGYDPETWVYAALAGGIWMDPLYALVENTYQTTNYINTGFDMGDDGSFSYESTENVGQDGEECLLYFYAELGFWDYVNDAKVTEQYGLHYGFPAVGELIETAYGDIENYDAETNAQSELQAE